MKYDSLPFVVMKDTYTNQTRQEHYRMHSDVLNEQRISLLESYHKAKFCVSGTSHLMPEFMVSDLARKSLIYPQGFLLLEANDGYYTDRSNLESYELRYTLDGEGILQYDGKTYSLSKGEGYFIDCRKRHYYRTAGKQWTSTILHFNGKHVASMFKAYIQTGSVKFNSISFPNFEMLQMQILQATQRISPYVEYKISCLFDILLTDLLVTRSKASITGNIPNIIEKITQYMQSNYMSNFKVEDLSHKFGISRTHLTRRFHEYKIGRAHV